jgi:hypothetical protein
MIRVPQMAQESALPSRFGRCREPRWQRSFSKSHLVSLFVVAAAALSNWRSAVFYVVSMIVTLDSQLRNWFGSSPTPC